MTTSRFVQGFRALRLALHLAWGCATVAVAYPFLSRGQQLRLKQRWSRQLLDILCVRLDVDGRLSSAAGLLVANHISWLDIFAINAMAPTAFVAKDEVASWPLVGWLCARTETFFLRRASRVEARQMAGKMREALTAGWRLAVFPEGTTSAGNEVLPFHAALLQPALDAAVSLQPLAISYWDRNGRPCTAPAYVGETSLLTSLRVILETPEIWVRLCVLAPRSAADCRRREAAEVREAIAESLCLAGALAGVRPEALQA